MLLYGTMTTSCAPDMLKGQALASEVQAQIPRRTQYYPVPLHQAVPAADWALHAVRRAGQLLMHSHLLSQATLAAMCVLAAPSSADGI